MVFTTDQEKNKIDQNGDGHFIEMVKMVPMDVPVHMGHESPANNVNGSAVSVNTTSAVSSSTVDLGYSDDIIAPSISYKERAKECCQSCLTLDTLKRKLPIIVWLPQYNFVKFQYDLIAGITVGMTLIPQGLAYAGIAGLPPVYGLYSGFISCFIYTLMGSAKDITVGPSAIMSLLTASFATSLSPKLPDGTTDPTMAIMLAFTTGLIHIFMGVFNLGIIVSYISFPVINAFSSAAAITIAVSQLKTLLGLKNVPNDFVASLDNIRQRLTDINVWDMTMGFSSILLVVLIKKLREIKFKQDPNKETPIYKLAFRQSVSIIGSGSTCIVVILASIVLYILEENGIHAITPTGYIKPGLPDFIAPRFDIHIGNFSMPSSDMFAKMAPGIIVSPIIALIEAMAIGKFFARINRYKLDPNQELLSYGISNILTSFFQGYPVTGTFSRTAINAQCGVKTTLSCIFTGIIVIIALSFMTPIFYYIPKCALAGVIIAAVLAMVDVNTFWTLYKANKIDVFPYLVTFAATLLIGVQWGIFVGMGVSLLILLYPLARPKVLFSTVQGFMIVTPTTGLNFPSAEYLEIKALDRALDVEKPQHVILNMEHLSNMDFSGVQAIKSLLAECEVNGLKLVLAQGQKRVRKQLKRAKIKNLKVVHTIDDAVNLFTEQIVAGTDQIEIEDGHFMSRL